MNIVKFLRATFFHRTPPVAASEGIFLNHQLWRLNLKIKEAMPRFCILLNASASCENWNWCCHIEVIMANFSQDITRNQFLWKLMVPPHKQTLSCNTYGKKKGLLLFSPLPPPSLISFPPVFSFFFILTPYLIKQ